MKYFFLFFAVIAIGLPLTALHANTISQCQNEKRGYCVVVTSDAPRAATKNHASFLLAQAGVPFPGLEFLQTYGISFDSDIGDMLAALYKFGVSIAAVSALIMFTFAGITYLTAGDSSGQVGKAKGYITNAVIGLVLIAASYLILYTINPDFTFTLKLKNLKQFSTEGGGNSSQPPGIPPGGYNARCSVDGFVGLPSDCISHCGALGGTCSIVPSQPGQAVCPTDGFIGFPADCINHCGPLGGTCKLLPS